MIKSYQIFPSIIILCMIGAGIVYYIKGDFRLSGYWILAAALNAVVTY